MIDTQKVAERVRVTASHLGIEKIKADALANDVVVFLEAQDGIDTGRSAIHDDAPIPQAAEVADDQPE